MMEQMFKAIANSPVTRLSETITADATSIPILDSSKLPTGPNIATIGIGANSETIKYEKNSSGTLTGVTRGVEGVKREWPKGTEIARFYTAYDHDTFVENILSIVAIKESGSNANGAYLKFEDGTMICYRSSLTLDYVNGDLNVVWVYPQPFSEVPTVLAVRRQAELYATKRIPSITVMTQSVDKASISLQRHTNDVFVATDKGLINAFAIGRWK